MAATRRSRTSAKLPLGYKLCIPSFDPLDQVGFTAEHAVTRRDVPSCHMTQMYPLVSTGFDVLDELLGGGLAEHDTLEIFGPADSGHELLARQIVVNVEDGGGLAAVSAHTSADETPSAHRLAVVASPRRDADDDLPFFTFWREGICLGKFYLGRVGDPERLVELRLGLTTEQR